MKLNKLAPGHNIMWESSRMMLPEHKQRLVEHQKENLKKEKPILDEQLTETFMSSIYRAMKHKSRIRFQLFDLYKDQLVEGQVQSVDLVSRQIKLLTQVGTKSINLDEIIDVVLQG